MTMDYPNPNFTEEVHVDLGTANVPALTGELSITAWVNPDNDGLADDNIIISKSDTTGNNGAFKLQLEEPDLELRGVINDSQITSSGTLVPGDWSFVAMVYDGSDKTLFINAVEDGSSAESGNIDIDSDPLLLGATDDGSIKREFDGPMADIRVYTRALSLAELQTMFALLGVDGIVDGLLWRWMQRELSPGTAATISDSIIDFAGNLNGTPVNSPVYQAGILR